MRRMIAALALVFILAACSEAEPVQSAEPDRAEIEQIVRSYILENPEIIEEALIELQRRARNREQMAMVNAVNANSVEIYQDQRAPVVGPDGAAVTIVEFFDYRCSFCILTNDWLQNVIAEHGDRVRVVFKEFPIRGAESVESSRAALAVWNTQPDAYLAFHDGLMRSGGPLPTTRIDEIAAASGVDVQVMRSAMQDDAIVAYLEDVRSVAQDVGITGTPFFIIGDEIIPGADMDRMQSALDSALAAAG